MCGVGEERCAAERVAAIAWDVVDADAALRLFGGNTGRIDGDFGGHPGVRHRDPDVATGLERHRVHTVLHDPLIARAAAVNREARHRIAQCTTAVDMIGVHSSKQYPEA